MLPLNVVAVRAEAEVVAKVEVAETFKPVAVANVNKLEPAVVLAPEANTTCPELNEPDNLLLKFIKSLPCN